MIVSHNHKRHNIQPSDEAFWEGAERVWAWVKVGPSQPLLSGWVFIPAALVAAVLTVRDVLGMVLS